MVLGGGAFRQGLGGAVINGISALIRHPKIAPGLSAMGGHKEKTAIYEPASRYSADSESADALILNFPVCKTMRNKLLLL